MGDLARKSQSATPTTFHQLLQYLDGTGQLFRVYTQNIDCLEAKCGMSFGIPTLISTTSSRCRKSKTSPPSLAAPRCIPLHGRIDTLYCINCSRTFPAYPHIDTLVNGSLPLCGDCVDLEQLRPFTGKRSRGVGRLRPSVVLYNESHRFADVLGEVFLQDLCHINKHAHNGGHLLLVAGTSLEIPGVKQMVRDAAKVLHSQPTSTFRNSSPTSLHNVRSVYLNLDFPTSMQEWKGVFDAWLYGDLQEFSRMVLSRLNCEASARLSAT
jgi:NAD-dependent SIR2 family protein deacetylase